MFKTSLGSFGAFPIFNKIKLYLTSVEACRTIKHYISTKVLLTDNDIKGEHEMRCVEIDMITMFIMVIYIMISSVASLKYTFGNRNNYIRSLPNVKYNLVSRKGW